MRFNVEIGNRDIDPIVIKITPWNEVRFRLLHKWWILKDRVIRFVTWEY